MKKQLLPLVALLLAMGQAFAETPPPARTPASRLATYGTRTSVASSPNPSTLGTSVTFTATVRSADFFGPITINEGTVTFSEGATVLAADVPVTSNVASFSTASLTVGTHPITVTYNGTANLGTSSRLIYQTVDDPGACPTFTNNTAYVNASAIVGTNDGTTWDRAFLTLQAALDDARTCGVTQIWVAQGTYAPSASPPGASTAQPFTSADYSFHLVDGVAIYGGFSGTETQLSQRNWRQYPTILSGSNARNHVVTSANDGLATRLDGFTITGGRAGAPTEFTAEGQSFGGTLGAGVYLQNSSVTLSNLLITGNSCASTDNSGGQGGGMLMGGGSSVLTNVAFVGNSAYAGGGFSGGGAYTMTNCVFFGNTANASGGGMYTGGSPTLTNVVFANNAATRSEFSNGGAMANNGSAPTLINCTFFGNTAPGTGGTMYNVNGATVTDKNGIYYNNSNNGNTAYNGVLNFSSDTFTATTTLSGTDPKFVNSADPDGPDNQWMTADDGLALQSTSPAINAGTAAGAPTTDILGVTRTGNPDQGAYEYTSCVTPTAFTVTGGGSTCTGGSGVAIGLSGSESGVSYQLQRDGTDVGDPVGGTGSALSFGTFTTAGTYTVLASRSETCTAPMTGSATVSVSPPPTVSLSALAASYCQNASASTPGTPAGGSYAIDGGDPVSTFDPVSLSPGDHTVVYSYTDPATTCQASATQSVTILAPLFTQQPSLPENVSVCANKTVSITFQVNCPENTTFTAELSNPQGSFTSGTQSLGTVTPGVANALTIPALTTNGSAYRIQVVSNLPSFTSDPTGTFRVYSLSFNSTPTVSLTAVCAGNSIKVSFTVNGNCPFLPDNAFTAELSNASGSFASPVVLGSVAPGINTLTVPQTIPTGSGYRVRIRASNPALLSAQSAAFTVNQPSFASAPSVSLDNKCAGEAVRLSFSVGCAFFAGNVFTAQLSNSAGSFASPVNVGTVSAGALNSVVIPAGTPAGTGYKLRIVSSNPVVTSAGSANFKVKACGANREISPEQTGLRVVVSPNPSPEGKLRIAVSGAEGQALRVDLFNGLGQSVREAAIERASDEEILTWDISRQPQGLYLLRFNTSKESKTVKILH